MASKIDFINNYCINISNFIDALLETGNDLTNQYTSLKLDLMLADGDFRDPSSPAITALNLLANDLVRAEVAMQTIRASITDTQKEDLYKLKKQ